MFDESYANERGGVFNFAGITLLYPRESSLIRPTLLFIEDP